MRPVSEQRAWLASLTDRERRALPHSWEFWARPEQLPPPGSWRIWLVLAGRGFGKTRTGAEWVRQSVKRYPLVNLIAPTSDDARDIMVEGESGILAICPDDERPLYRPANRRLDWPNGAKSLIFTADEPERLRGKQHMRLWMDEIASWRHPDAYDQAMLGLRLGDDPKGVATTTPKPVRLIRELLLAPTTAVTRGTTYDNAPNLAPAFLEQIITKYEGTTTGQQELEARVLEESEGALWKRAYLRHGRAPEDLARVVVGVDPAGTHRESSNETGIVVAARGTDGRGYVLHDASGRYSPDGWARRAVGLYEAYRADRIVPETNHGGEMVTHTIRTVDPDVPVRPVSASRGKAVRAEPIAALYQQGNIDHCGDLADLEDQLCTWDPASRESPDRLDALVWALTDLMRGRELEVL